MILLPLYIRMYIECIEYIEYLNVCWKVAKSTQHNFWKKSESNVKLCFDGELNPFLSTASHERYRCAIVQLGTDWLVNEYSESL